MTADALALLFRRLVLAAQEAQALARPIEVGEILDKLVPYRAARRDGLLESNDDYLHAMMQLLAGERGYLFADELMQDDLKNELTALNPDLGVLTTYRTTKVRIASAEAARVLAGDTSIDLRPPTPVAIPSVPGGVARVSAEPIAPPAPVAPVESVAATCPYCSKDVSTDRPLKYCPHCGINLRIRRCPGCSAEMEAEWKFCVTCGRSAP